MGTIVSRIHRVQPRPSKRIDSTVDAHEAHARKPQTEEELYSEYDIARGFSDAFRKGKKKLTNEHVLLKKISKGPDFECSLKELTAMKSFSHPNILKIYDVCVFDDGLVAICQCIDGSVSLDDRLCLEGPLDNAQALLIARQLIGAVVFLHDRNLFHLDLKISNILMPATENYPVVICDLGFAMSEGVVNMGTPYCIAPELLQQNPVRTPKVDIWNVGVIVFMMLLGRQPFKCDARRLVHYIRNMPVGFEEDDPVSPEARTFICRCMEKDPEARPSSKDLDGLGWFTEVDNNDGSTDIADEDKKDDVDKIDAEQPSVIALDSDPNGATYGIRYDDMVKLLQRYSEELNQHMFVQKFPGCVPLYGGLSSAHLREHFVKHDIYPPTDPSSKHLFVKCNTVDVAISYLWQLPLKGVIELLRGDTRRRCVSGHEIVWIDILAIYQNAPDITKALSVSKEIYEHSSRHVVLTLETFDRMWCLYEMYLRMNSVKATQDLPSSELLESRCIGGSSDQQQRLKDLRRVGAKNIFESMQAYSALDMKSVKSIILNTTTAADFDNSMRSLFAKFVRNRRCSMLMEAIICMYMGGKVANPVVLRRYIEDNKNSEVVFSPNDLEIIEHPADW